MPKRSSERFQLRSCSRPGLGGHGSALGAGERGQLACSDKGHGLSSWREYLHLVWDAGVGGVDIVWVRVEVFGEATVGKLDLRRAAGPEGPPDRRERAREGVGRNRPILALGPDPH